VTTLIKRFWPGSEDLHAAILAELAVCHTTTRGPSTLGDDQKPRRAPGFFTWDLPAAREIRQRFLVTLDQGRNWSFDAWANINRRGDGNRVHNHGCGPGSAKWSGIYYVSDGGGDAPTVFIDRVSGERRVFPVPGLLVIFPSSIRHAVEPHNGWGERVTIAVNAYPISGEIRGDGSQLSEVGAAVRPESKPDDSGENRGKGRGALEVYSTVSGT
jgi:hypothetical protein